MSDTTTLTATGGMVTVLRGAYTHLMWGDRYTLCAIFAGVPESIGEALEASVDCPECLAESERLHAQCEHGLAAWLCVGPSHYPMD